ncbi:hypothetical protein GWK91_15830 [Virgibacillus sp. MSP4-1]|uniref:PilN domain-containing protein n=1 Tax=Virgibacillus sp. MSP4-1 TaxID=2700081 RepID=UPI0003A76545|nr:PilN domain-containing protein [Virgibacillus sp. MSP4-1]QHS24272.1 hypothetical protein GWK91_15830 [Virgibacillus sp. MSP4-1]
MLVEINLLQKREQNSKGFQWFVISMIGLIVLLIAVVFLLTTLIKNDIERTESALSEIKTIRADLQGEMSNSGYQDLQSLESSVTSLNRYPIDSDLIIAQLSELLPENGYFDSYEYTGDRVVLQVLVQEDVDASHYLYHLNQQDWITSVSLSTVSSDEAQLDGGGGTTANGLDQPPSYLAQYDIALNRDSLREGTE